MGQRRLNKVVTDVSLGGGGGVRGVQIDTSRVIKTGAASRTANVPVLQRRRVTVLLGHQYGDASNAPSNTITVVIVIGVWFAVLLCWQRHLGGGGFRGYRMYLAARE